LVSFCREWVKLAAGHTFLRKAIPSPDSHVINHFIYNIYGNSLVYVDVILGGGVL